MPIGKDNLKLMKSQRMTDNDDGGGRITGTQIIDNVSNEIFDDITDLDRVTGNVSLRKIYPWVDTTDTDGYFGANIILANTPDDEYVDITMMKTGDFDDERAQAQEKIERYLVKANQSDYGLLGNHFQGQRSLNWFAIEQRLPPSPGETYTLENAAGTQQEYVRLVDVDAELTTFVKFDVNGNLKEFQAWNIVAEISAPIVYDYIGGDAEEDGVTKQASEDEEPAPIFNTQVADAARYYGIKPLTQPASIGDSKVYVDSLFSSIVPAGQAEQPLVDENAAVARVINRPITAQPLTANNETWSNTGDSFAKSIYLPTAIVPGTLTITMLGGGGGTSTHQDVAKNGTLTRTAGTAYQDNMTVDYDTGIVTATAAFSGGGPQAINYSYTPGEKVSSTIVSDLEYVTAVTRGFNYSKSFPADTPAPGSLVVAYMVFGEWYELTDDGYGQITGAGSGTVNYETGTIQVTLQELPDVDSYIIYQFVPEDPGAIADLTGTQTSPLFYNLQTANEDKINPGSVVVTYTSGATQYTADDSDLVNNDATLAGDGSGTIDYTGGTVTFTPDRIPDPGTDIQLDYETSTYDSTTILNANIVKKTAQTGTVPAGTGITHLSIIYTSTYTLPVNAVGDENTITQKILIASDGAGGLRYKLLDQGGTWIALPNSTFDLSTGAYSIQWPIYQIEYRKYGFGGIFTETKNLRLWPNDPNTDLEIRTRFNDASTASATPVTAQTSSVQMTLPVSNIQGLLRGSLVFDWLDNRYYDDGQGNLLVNYDHSDGTSTIAGGINYGTGQVSINSFSQVGGLQTDLVVVAAGGIRRIRRVDQLIFRTLGAPIRPQSFQISAVSLDEDVPNPVASIQADADGNFDTGDDAIVGTINYETGVVSATFDPDVDPFQILYNAVQLVFLPLDPEIVGLDPVRLPQDGRIPIYRTGDIVVVHNEKTTEVATPTANDVIDAGRARLAEVRIYDANGDIVPATQYTEDLDAGTVTLADPIDTSTSPAPWSVIDRVEDMALVNDVDISGEISLTRQISHTFPDTTTYLSTAMVLGDLQARVTNVFDQATWTNEWSDLLIGNEPSAEYDNTTYPIEVDNRGTLYQRWALVFTGSTSFNIIGETVGNVGVGNTSSDIAPTNPNTSTPYFTIRSLGWGAGWAAGNVLRFNTISSNYPVWIARSVSQSNPTDTPDQFRLQVRGNINT